MISMFQASVIKSKRNTKRHHNSCRVKKRKKEHRRSLHDSTQATLVFSLLRHVCYRRLSSRFVSLTERMEQFNICYAKVEVGAFSDDKPQPAIHKFHKKKNEKNFFNQCFPRPFFPSFHFNPLLLILRAGMMTQILCFDLIPTQHCDLLFLWCQCWRSFQIFGLGKLETQRKI